MQTINAQIRQAQQINPELDNHAKLWFLGYRAALDGDPVPTNEIEKRGYLEALKLEEGNP